MTGCLKRFSLSAEPVRGQRGPRNGDVARAALVPAAGETVAHAAGQDLVVMGLLLDDALAEQIDALGCVAVRPRGEDVLLRFETPAAAAVCRKILESRGFDARAVGPVTPDVAE